jgi:hypothetical protein
MELLLDFYFDSPLCIGIETAVHELTRLQGHFSVFAICSCLQPHWLEVLIMKEFGNLSDMKY